MKRTIVGVLATVAMSGLSAGVAATPAFADCPANTFCLYQTHDYQDGEYTFTFSQAGDDCRNLEGINNDANSMRNYRDHDVMLWDLPGCGGDSTYRARANSYDSNFGNNDFSNKASSLKRL